MNPEGIKSTGSYERVRSVGEFQRNTLDMKDKGLAKDGEQKGMWNQGFWQRKQHGEDLEEEGEGHLLGTEGTERM